MLFGKSTLPLSEQCALTLPGDYGKAMGSTVFLTQGFERNLVLLTREGFTSLSAQLGTTSLSDPLARLLRRMLLGSAAEVRVDDDGQIELPAALCQFAGLEKEIVLVGQGEYLEIWSPARWQEQVESMNATDDNARRFEKFNLAAV